MTNNSKFTLNKVLFFIFCFLGFSNNIAQTGSYVNVLDFGARSDGSLPNADSYRYKKPIIIKNNGELKSIAIGDGFLTSDVITSTFKKVMINAGIQYKYYVGRWKKIPNILKLTPEKTGIVERFSLGEVENNKDHFAILMYASINIKEAGAYIFYVGSNDGSQLVVDMNC